MATQKRFQKNTRLVDPSFKSGGLFDFNGVDYATFVKDGEVWFRMTDICRAIGHSSPTRAARGLDDDERQIVPLPSESGVQDQVMVSESGLYHFLVKSQLPLAVTFRRRVTKEVLPSIRRNGFYSRPGVKLPIPEAQSPDPADLTRLQEMRQLPGRYMVLSLPGRPLHVEVRDMEEVLLDYEQADLQTLVNSTKLVGSLWRAYRTEVAMLAETLLSDEGFQQLDHAISISARYAQWIQRASENKALALAKATTK
ncbi:BRO family protein [Gluconobacter sp. OJB]|uniref:BRO-N domain-containing protein n=1 Tax=Gluconobacter sp. OJB TaxID=3145196 RepID=UPI0031F9FCBC